MKKLGNLQTVVMFITNRCNLKCSYCYVCQGTDVMSFDVAKKVIDNVDDLTLIDFFGGEALLELPLLNQIVDYAKSQDRKLIFQVYTNGTRYDDEVKALVAKGVNISVSLDGLAMNDRTHSDELSKLIFANAKAMKADRKGLGVKVAITPQNVHGLLDNIKFLYSEGFDSISHFLIREDVWDAESIEMYRIKSQEAMDWYLENIHKLRLSFFDGFLFDSTREYACWAGNNGVAVNCNGDLYPCQRFLTNGSPFLIGNVDDGITNKNFSRYNAGKFVGCSKCELCNRCSVCIAAQWENGAMFKPISCVCELTKITHEASSKLEPYRDYIWDRFISKNGKPRSPRPSR